MASQLTETVQFEGVMEPLPKYWGDSMLAIYYCNYCQTPPEVAEGQIAVSVAHSNCSKEALLKGLKLLAVL